MSLMNIKRSLYYPYLIFCVFLILIHLVGPYGGISFIWDYIKRGFFNIERTSLNTLLDIAILYLNQALALLFWLCVIIPLIVTVLKFPIAKKWNIAFYCMVILSLIIFVPKLIGIIV